MRAVFANMTLSAPGLSKAKGIKLVLMILLDWGSVLGSGHGLTRSVDVGWPSCVVARGIRGIFGRA